MSAGDLLGPLPEAAAPRRSASHGEAGYKRKAHDAYFTEPWVTRALLLAVDFHLADQPAAVIWEPACGDGRMARPLAEAGYEVEATDLNDWGFGTPGVDFLHCAPRPGVAAIVTNPPFNLAVPFIERALEHTRAIGGQVAMLQRHEFDAPASNHPLFRGHPFAAKLVLHTRPWWGPKPKRGSTKGGPRFPYAWFWWNWRQPAPGPTQYLPDPALGRRSQGVLL